MLRIPALVALLGLTACELTEVTITVPEDVIIAQTNLVVELNREGSDNTLDVFAYLHRTINPRVERTVPGATISIASATDTVVLAETEEGVDCLYFVQLPPGDTLLTEHRREFGSCYRARITPSPFAPGDELSQVIATRDGRRLTGISRIPGAFAFEALNLDGGRCRLEPGTHYRFSWNRVADSWAYLSGARFEGLRDALAVREIVSPDTLDLLGFSFGNADTEVVFPREYGFFSLFDEEVENIADIVNALQEGMPVGASAELAIVAVDRNWTNWARGGNFNPSGEVHIPSVFGEGGTGAFVTGTGRWVEMSAEPGETAPLCGVLER